MEDWDSLIMAAAEQLAEELFDRGLVKQGWDDLTADDVDELCEIVANVMYAYDEAVENEG